MKYLILPPPPELAPHVKYFGAFRIDDVYSEKLQISTLVNDASGIVIQHHNGRSAMMESGQFIPESMVYGISTKPKINIPVSGFSAVAVIFQPLGMYELLKVNASELTDQEIHLNDFAGWNITDAIINTSDFGKQIDILIHFLRHRLRNKNESDVLVQDCLDKIQASQGSLTVKALLKHYKISERLLQRRFNEKVGTSPRHYLKITRFREVLNLFRQSDERKLSDIAYELNYSDQAHFIKHVKQLSGFSPKELNKRLQAVDVNQNSDSPYLMGAAKII